MYLTKEKFAILAMLLGVYGLYQPCLLDSEECRSNTSLFQAKKADESKNPNDDQRFKGHTHDVTSLAFSSDGKRLVSAASRFNDPKGEVKSWDIITGEEVRALTLNLGGKALNLVLSPDGKQAVCFSFGEIVREGGEWRETWVRHFDLVSGKEVRTLSGLPKSPASSFAGRSAFSPDGKYLAASSGKKMKVWDVGTGQEIWTKEFEGTHRVAYSPDGKQLATVRGATLSGVGDPAISLLDAASGQKVLTFKGHGHNGLVMDVAFSPDGKRLASASRDQTLKVWDTADGQELLTLKGHADWVWTVAFSPDGKRLASTSRDGTMKLWDTASGQEPMTLRVSSKVYHLAFSPDGKRLAGAGADGISVWDALKSMKEVEGK